LFVAESMAEAPMAIGPETPDDGDELSAPLSPLYSESSDLEEISRRSSRCTSTDRDRGLRLQVALPWTPY